MVIGKEMKTYIDNNINKLGFDGFIVALGEALASSYRDNSIYKGSKHQKKYFRKILKYLLSKYQVGGTIIVSDINRIYPSKYPENKLRTVNGFEQFEVVLDTTEKGYQLGVVLDIFPEVYNSPYNGLQTQELRLDTNGVMCDEYVKKVDVDKFMKYFDPTNDYGIKLLHSIFMKPKNKN